MDALDGLVPLDDSYAARPLAEAFSWATVTDALPVGREWYLVAFRSVRRAGCDEARLCEFDERAHLEAAGAPGFVHYFKGPTASDGTCLSFCLWETRAHARAASGRPDHRAAVELLHEMYEHYTLEFLRVTHERGARSLSFEPYDALPPDAGPDVHHPTLLPHGGFPPHAEPSMS
jgi:hypothetical protein